MRNIAKNNGPLKYKKNMTEVTNLQELKTIIGGSGLINDGVEIRYVKGHTTSGDGGGGIFIWRTLDIFTSTNPTIGKYSTDNNGTIIQSINNGIPNNNGRWIRQYDGYINVLYFGCFGVGNDYTVQLQRAVDFASQNSKSNPTLKGSTVYLPNGSYVISNILLKTGVSILGESIERTLIYSPGGLATEYLFEIESGPVFLNISNLRLIGNNTEKGCFRFKASNGLEYPFHGGLWNSKISDIEISNFRGHGIYLFGGGDGSDGLLPNQFNVFENVRVSKTTDFSNALKMNGQNGQISFINCTFDGFFTSTGEGDDTVYYFSRGHNINIQNEKQYTSAVISFINCTCQAGDYGMVIEWAENITMDNCWFESLGVAITVKSNYADKNNDVPCKSINILNNRFANAAGFGSLNAPKNIKDGQCVNISKSFVTVNNNFVVVTKPEGQYFNDDSAFLVAYNNTIGGVNAINNTFQAYKLGKTFGIMEVIEVDSLDNSIDCSGHKLLFVNGSNTIIKTIKSFICGGEILIIRANTNPITFSNAGNIFFSTLNPNNTFQLNNGEIATFVKIDNFVTPNFGTYQLVSIMRQVV